ncbi:DUF2510 domain-containing protein [uncultured Schumannella sp.]|uniref:DUF2510 domain-containing protein n=1 Tax=uncultured Schumannella sp. TaxID=1195956 RepID=UPI0025F63DA5|nr:DUF2510 domain-containing protein [uncultured Schumannella sp.]
MTQVPDSTEAGWYPDPTDAQSLRWWDGMGWTTHISAKLIETIPRVTPTAGELRVRVRGAHAAPSDDDVELSADAAPEPGQAADDPGAAETRRARRPQLRPRDERAAGRAAFGDLS